MNVRLSDGKTVVYRQKERVTLRRTVAILRRRVTSSRRASRLPRLAKTNPKTKTPRIKPLRGTGACAPSTTHPHPERGAEVAPVAEEVAGEPPPEEEEAPLPVDASVEGAAAPSTVVVVVLPDDEPPGGEPPDEEPPEEGPPDDDPPLEDIDPSADESPVEASLAAAGTMLRSEMPNLGRSKSTFTAPPATAIVCAG